MQNIFEGVEVANDEDGELLETWRDGGGLPSAEEVAARVDAGVDAVEVVETSQVQGKTTTEAAEGREAGGEVAGNSRGKAMRHLCVPSGKVPGGGKTPSDVPDNQERASTPVRSAAASDSELEGHDENPDDDGYIDDGYNEEGVFLEDEEGQPEEEQQRKLEAARSNYSEAITVLRKAYANSREFIDRLKEMGLETEGLLKEGEVASEMDAEVSSTVSAVGGM